MRTPGDKNPAGTRKSRNPGGRTRGEVTAPSAEWRLGTQEDRGWPPHARRILIGCIFQDIMHMHCIIAGSLVHPLNGGLLDWAPAHSCSESPLIGPHLPGSQRKHPHLGAVTRHPCHLLDSSRKVSFTAKCAVSYGRC